MFSDPWFFFDFVFYCVSTWGAQCILIWGKYCPSSLSSLYVWHPASLLYWDRLYHSFSWKISEQFFIWWKKSSIQIKMQKNFQQSTSPVVLKTRTFRLATKLRQKFNRFSPFRKLTSFVTSFTAYVIYAASPDTYNKSGEDNFISLKSFLDKKDWEIGQWRWKLMSGQKRGLGCITPSPSLQLLQIHSTKFVKENYGFIIFWG